MHEVSDIYIYYEIILKLENTEIFIKDIKK